jgi:hypothetical protein
MALTEEQRKTIRVAREAYRIMLEEQFFPAMKQYVEMANARKEIYRGSPWMPKPKPAEKPQVDLAEQKALQELLDEVKNSKETK